MAELASLDVADVWHEGQPRSVLFVRAAIAKGNRGCSVPLCKAARDAVAGLVAFLAARGFSSAPGAPLLVVRQHRRISIVSFRQARLERVEAGCYGQGETSTDRRTHQCKIAWP